MRKLTLSLFCLLLSLPVTHLCAESDSATSTPDRPPKLFAHYMGCFPVGCGPMEDARRKNPYNNEKFRHNSADPTTIQGGRFLAWPFAPPLALTAVESADLEIRRALREGVDGFAIDAWAGGDLAKATLDALFTAAEAGHYPFEITLCLDAWCVSPRGKDGYYEAVKYLLDRHGTSANLARRDGKPLIFTYQGQGIAMDVNRTTESGWAAMTVAYKDLEVRLGQPLFISLDISQIFLKQQDQLQQPVDKAYVEAATWFSNHYFGAIGGFTDWGSPGLMEKLSEAVHTGPADWSPPLWYQYLNVAYGGGPPRTAPGIGTLVDKWERARTQKARLLQFITWNDYGEHTSLAPTDATGYGIGDLNAWFATWWKTGTPPEAGHDRVYVIYRVHTGENKSFPWQGEGQTDTHIEVVTLLPREAQIRLPGRTVDGKPIEYTAPAGFSIKEFPLTSGPIDVDLIRDGKVAAHVHGREAVSDRPFRHDVTLYCASTEDEKYWKEDFPGVPYPTYSYYGDDDHNGLPNWFEMYWFGKWNDFSTATGHDPDSDPFHTGKSLRQHYLDQTNPTKPSAHYPVGWIWDALTFVSRGSFNPDIDEQDTPVWFYLYKEGAPGETLAHDGKYERMSYREHDGWWSNSKCAGRIDLKKAGNPVLEIRGTPQSPTTAGCLPIFAWQSPIDGTVAVDLQVDRPDSGEGSASVTLESNDGTILWSHEYAEGEIGTPVKIPDIKVAKGSWLYLVNDGNSRKITVPLYRITVKTASSP